MVMPPAMAAPAGPTRRPSSIIRTPFRPPPKVSTAWLRMIRDIAVSLPAAAAPIRSTRQSLACSTTSFGMSPKRSLWVKATAGLVMGQLQGNGLLETGCSLPSGKREIRNGSSRRFFWPLTISPAASLPTAIIL